MTIECSKNICTSFFKGNTTLDELVNCIVYTLFFKGNTILDELVNCIVYTSFFKGNTTLDGLVNCIVYTTTSSMLNANPISIYMF